MPAVLRRFPDMQCAVEKPARPDTFICAAARVAGDAVKTAALIHGGFWRAAYGPDLMDALAADLTARGWDARCISYRRVGEAGGGWPGTFDDVRAAVDGADLVVGHSAGGHLALWAACSVVRRPRLAVSMGGVVDLYECHAQHLSRDAVVELLGGTPDEVPERYAAASPQACAGVPMLLVHGALDDEVPVSMSTGFTGAQVEVVVVPDEGHYECLDPASQSWAEVVQRL